MTTVKIFAVTVLFAALPAGPMKAALTNPTQVAYSRPAAVLRVGSGSNPISPEMPEATSLLLAGGALLGLGLMGRKRGAQNAPADR
jgi:hypothetical protein